MFSKIGSATVLVSTFVALAIAPSACSSSTQDDSVSARVEVTGKSRAALTASTITAVHGTYGGNCRNRASAGTDAWTVDLATPSATTLAVIKDDPSCTLSVTGLDTAGATFVGSPAISMSAAATYASSPSAFAPSGGGPTAFYGNAEIDSLSYNQQFLITVMVSDDSNTSSQSGGEMSYATRTASVESENIPAPDYTLSLDGLTLKRGADDVVDTVVGYAQLEAGAVAGEDYAFAEGVLDGSNTMSDIETAWSASTAHGALSSLHLLELPASGFSLDGESLDDGGVQRTVIIRHVDSATGVPSYQLLGAGFSIE